MAIEVFAPAKINLTLHVTGRRPDGYHLLDSLVVFAPVGDTVTLSAAGALSLDVTGPESEGVPGDMSNLALRGAALAAGEHGALLRLDKRLPAASGIGGGSADAAAAVRGMLALRGMPEAAPEGLLELGADVPMCFASRPLRVRGIGEVLEPLFLPGLPALLVNPRRPVPTPEVFCTLGRRSNPPMPDPLPALASREALIAFLSEMRNDLEAPALQVQPAIRDVLAAIGAQAGCALARMSGSGATCFGLFGSEAETARAAEALRRAEPGWWVEDTVLGDLSGRAAARVQ